MSDIEAKNGNPDWRLDEPPRDLAEDEAAAWGELERDELTGQEIRAIADHLCTTGEASA